MLSEVLVSSVGVKGGTDGEAGAGKGSGGDPFRVMVKVSNNCCTDAQKLDRCCDCI